MMQLRLAIVTAITVILGATVARAQDMGEARRAILQGANLGDRITVTLEDGGEMRGRLVAIGDGLTLGHGRDERTFEFSDIDSVSRDKNGMILGPIIGTAAGFALGLPVRTRFNNEGENGGKALTVLVVSGAAIGTLLDALMGSERTIYRRPRLRMAFTIAPTGGGVTARWQKTW